MMPNRLVFKSGSRHLAKSKTQVNHLASFPSDLPPALLSNTSEPSKNKNLHALRR